MFNGRMRREALLLLKALMKDENEADDEISVEIEISEAQPQGKADLVMLNTSEVCCIQDLLSSRWRTEITELEADMLQHFRGVAEVDRPHDVWSWGNTMNVAQLNNYSGRKRAILTGVGNVAEDHRACKVRDMRFRKDSLEKEFVYADSGVAVGAKEGRLWEKIGKVERIVKVTVRKLHALHT